jgi:signal peptidase
MSNNATVSNPAALQNATRKDESASAGATHPEGRAFPGRFARVRAMVSQLLTVLGLGAFALVVGLLVFVALAPRLIGWHFVIVSGSSMEPTVPFGSLAVIEEVPPGDIQPGDIVTFAHPVYRNKVVTHRVVSIGPDGQATTKGDANSHPDDGSVGVQQIHYRFRFAIPEVGRAVHWLRTRPGMIAAVLVPGIIAIFMEMASIWREVRAMRSGRRRERAAASRLR